MGVERLSGASIKRVSSPIERAHPAVRSPEACDPTLRSAIAVSALPVWAPYTAEMGHSEAGFRAGGRSP